MKLAVISDIHSNLDALEAVLCRLRECDRILCLGDLVGYGPQPNEVIERLQRLSSLTVLMGNHDYAVVSGDASGFSDLAATAVKWTREHIKQENLRYLSALLPSARIEEGGMRFALYHGSPSDPLNEYVFPGLSNEHALALIRASDANIVLLGHTHIPMVQTFKRMLLANPGSVGQPRDGDPRASFAVLTVSESDLRFEIIRVEYDIDSVARKIEKTDLPRFVAERLYLGM